MFKYSFYKYSLILIVSLLFFSSCSTRTYASKGEEEWTRREEDMGDITPSENKAVGGGGGKADDDSAKIIPSLRVEAWELTKLASPIMIVSMLQFLMVMVDMGMVRRLCVCRLCVCLWVFVCVCVSY